MYDLPYLSFYDYVICTVDPPITPLGLGHMAWHIWPQNGVHLSLANSFILHNITFSFWILPWFYYFGWGLELPIGQDLVPRCPFCLTCWVSLSSRYFADPEIMKKLQVDRGAIKFVLAGANIMCPGLTSPGGALDDEVMEETPVVWAIAFFVWFLNTNMYLGNRYIQN